MNTSAGFICKSLDAPCFGGKRELQDVNGKTRTIVKGGNRLRFRNGYNLVGDLLTGVDGCKVTVDDD